MLTSEEVVDYIRKGRNSDTIYHPMKDDMGKQCYAWLLSGDPGWVNVLGMTSPRRPGVMSTFVLMEHLYFDPNTEANDYFLMFDTSLDVVQFSIVAVPVEYKPQFEDVAAKCGVRLTRKMPMMVSSSGTHRLPPFGDNTFMLENVKDHPVYQQDNLDDLSTVESKFIEGVLDGSIDIEPYRYGNLAKH